MATQQVQDDLLRKSYPLFEDQLVNEIEELGEFRTFPANEILMRKGQYIRSTMLVLNGLIKVYREDDDGNEFLMYYLKPGEACALSLVCAAKHEASPIMAKTVVETEVMMVPVDTMSEWMSKFKSWYQFVIETYRARFDELLVTLDNVAFRSMDERLEFYLKRAKDAQQTTLLNISHQEIAQELNTSREVISRLLKKMEQKGLVGLHRNAIELKNL
ncbi:Crp/Fnr family transcriptional regulator [Lacibacter sediminis]|uniref:Crp/Fnr family transcriptional regulator n=1 Tax=Lacibacter sediminis TaxID=2760713 RepID=A0A7G5XFZ9_9BACT|nr:Crp/Fnr family transcriptional regulator [Lacibacter sediminis]QNA44402.1 Crp/Fnr family transcriptional regulator [Lacibacter sediminis]